MLEKGKQILWVDDKWHNYFCRLTLEVASMSTCLRRNVGCVIINGKQVVSTGYNGVPSGVPHCEKCPREGLPSGTGLELCRASHAEQNAVAQAAKHGIALDGCTAYVNLQPCNNCMKSLINAGIKKVVYMDGYPDDMTHDLAEKAGVKLIKLQRRDGQ